MSDDLDDSALARLFVYGSLQPGHENAHELEGIVGSWQPATVRGRVLDRGWGAGLGYPALVPDPRGPTVHGALLTSADLPRHLARLDAFEGDGYERTTVLATLEGGRRVPAQVYALRDRDGEPRTRDERPRVAPRSKAEIAGAFTGGAVIGAVVGFYVFFRLVPMGLWVDPALMILVSAIIGGLVCTILPRHRGGPWS